MRMLTESHWLKLKEYLRLSEDPKDIIVELALHTGARVSEIIRLRRKDFRGNKVSITASKGSNNRVIDISPDLRLKISLLDFTSEQTIIELATKSKSPASKKRIIHRHIDFLTLWLLGESYSMHCLRHTIFSMLYKKTGDIHLVQQWAGHRSLASTLKYMHIDQIEKADKYIKQLMG